MYTADVANHDLDWFGTVSLFHSSQAVGKEPVRVMSVLAIST